MKLLVSQVLAIIVVAQAIQFYRESASIALVLLFTLLQPYIWIFLLSVVWGGLVGPWGWILLIRAWIRRRNARKSLQMLRQIQKEADELLDELESLPFSPSRVVRGCFSPTISKQ